MKTILLLFIIASCATQPPPPPKPSPDMLIKAAVEETLLLDPRIFPVAPQVEVRNGIVTLRGKLSKPEGRVAAEQDALNTKNVRSVINLLTVSTPVQQKINTEQIPEPKMMNGDSDIKLKAEMALEQSLTPEQKKNINVKVEGDVVVLKGEVKNNFVKEKAWFANANVEGVDKVRNELKVRPETVGQKDKQLEEEINYGLMWNSKIEWLDDKIDVTVKDRVAMLKGEVDSQEEKAAILSEVKEAGVGKVIDRIKVL